MKKVLFGVACAALVGGFLLAASAYKARRARGLGFMARENAAVFVRPHSPVLGADDAKVYVVEFTDPACETCAAFSEFVKQGMAANPGKLKLVVRYAAFHSGASDAVKVLEAARRQGRFWETLELLYATQEEWTQHHHADLSRIWPLLPKAGVDAARARKDMDDPGIAKVIEQDLADARTLNVQKTPGFFVNGRPLEPFGFEPLQALIEAEVRENYP
ncbi:MAG: thioredoxin domain-containing protein [Elusimicrobia bacterium]|nr:thioredoxin domain-containing protein [Elusimicrobiota bacterium]